MMRARMRSPSMRWRSWFLVGFRFLLKGFFSLWEPA
jgi:hypothetical protein